MKTKILSKKRLRCFIYETLKKAESNPSLYSAEGLADIINYRVELMLHPLDEWITMGGDFYTLIGIIEEILDK